MVVLNDKLESQVHSFEVDLRRRKIIGSNAIAKQTANVLRNTISSTRWNDAHTLLQNIKEVGTRLMKANHTEFAVGNIVRRVLYIIREEHSTLVREMEDITEETIAGNQGVSLHNIMEERTEDFTIILKDLKGQVILAVTSLIEEIENSYKGISEQSTQHIFSSEVILTHGISRTVEEFLKKAATKRKFEVIVVESSPTLQGHQLAVNLSGAGIQTTLIPDSAIFAIMSKVDKVIIGTHAVLANGGLVSLTGTHMVALAAKHYSVPLNVCCGLFKLTPTHPHNQDSYTDWLSPDAIIAFEEAEEFAHVNVQNPAYDYVPPELVALYITNFGGHSPTYVYRLLQEYYNPEDFLDDNEH